MEYSVTLLTVASVVVIDIAGFYFLDLATDYEPGEDLKRFLSGGPPPVYIGCILVFSYHSTTSVLNNV
jgi:hypothetical protein